jgi:flagellar biogenesis protein FliO
MSATVLSAADPGWWRQLRDCWKTWNQRRERVRRLRVNESVSLGEKRFVAVIQFEQQRFLVGGTGTSLSLLAELDSDQRATTRASEEP